MNDIFVMVDNGENPTPNDDFQRRFFGTPPRFGFSIKTDSLMNLVLQLPNQVKGPMPTKKPLHFGANGEYYQTWSNEIMFREHLKSLGLTELPINSSESLRFLQEWTLNLKHFLDPNQHFIEAGAKALRGP